MKRLIALAALLSIELGKVVPEKHARKDYLTAD